MAVGRHVRILVVRHGQSTWNASGRWQGQADPPLSELGEAQAAVASEALAEVAGAEPVGAVVASDLARARRTGEVLARRIGATVTTDARLREIHAGEWTGLTRPEIEAAWPGWLAEERRPPGFETREAVVARARHALHDVAARARAGRAAVVVSHSGVVRALERSLDVDGPVLPNLGGRWFHVDPDSGEIGVGERVLLLDPATVAVTVPAQQ